MGASYGNLRQVTSLMYFMQFKTKRPCSGMHVSNASSSFEVMLTCMPFPGPQIVFVPTVFAIAVFKGFFLEGTMCLFLYVVRGSFHSPWTGTCHFATSGPHSRQLSDFGAIHWPHPPTKTKCPGQGGGDSKIASLKLHPERVVCDMGCVPIGKQSTPMASISQPGSGKHIHCGHLLKLGFKNCGHLLQEKMQRVSNTTS